MARRKRKSEAVSGAETRAQSLRNIDTKLDLGNELTLEKYDFKIAETKKTSNAYNKLLADADVTLVELEKQERELRDLSERMLEGVGSKFGKNSEQYQKAGGTRKDQIVRGKTAKLDKKAA